MTWTSPSLTAYSMTLSLLLFLKVEVATPKVDLEITHDRVRHVRVGDSLGTYCDKAVLGVDEAATLLRISFRKDGANLFAYVPNQQVFQDPRTLWDFDVQVNNSVVNVTLSIPSVRKKDEGGVACVLEFQEQGKARDRRVALRLFLFVQEVGTNHPCQLPNFFHYTFEQTCVSFVTAKKSWADARRFCRKVYRGGGNLVQIRDQRLDSFVTGIMDLSGGKSAWVGVNDSIIKGQGSGKKKVNFTNWQAPPLDPSLEYCVEKRLGDEGRWSASGCDLRKQFLCQGPPGNLTSPPPPPPHVDKRNIGGVIFPFLVFTIVTAAMVLSLMSLPKEYFFLADDKGSESESSASLEAPQEPGDATTDFGNGLFVNRKGHPYQTYYQYFTEEDVDSLSLSSASSATEKRYSGSGTTYTTTVTASDRYSGSIYSSATDDT